MNNDIRKQKIESEVKCSPKAESESALSSSGKHYLLPKSDLFVWAWGCLDIVLKYSENARHDYASFIEIWNHPDFEPLYETLVSRMMSHPDYQPLYYGDPSMLIKDSFVAQELKAKIERFIKLYFNSERNMQYGRLRATAASAPYLAQAIQFRSQSDCAGIKLSEWERLTLEPVPEAMQDTNSRYHRQMRVALDEINAHLVNNKTIMRWCGIWRLARVEPGQINKAAEELAEYKYPELWWQDETRSPSEKYIRDNIYLADKATGYR